MITSLLGLGSGVVVGFVLGLVGGGGSVLAVPLLVNVVGVSSPHVAIGTSAVAVTLNALIGLATNLKRGTVKGRCAALFAGSGVIGAAFGAWLGKALDGQALLAAFGGLMVVVGATMFFPRRKPGQPDVRLTLGSAPLLAPRLAGLGMATGAASGFFGIGGGFLIVPSLMLATNMPIELAIGSSLVAVAAFGVTTAVSYAASGLVDWGLAAVFVLGGAVGSLLGSQTATRLAARRRALSIAFATLVVAVGVYVVRLGTAPVAHTSLPPAREVAQQTGALSPAQQSITLEPSK